MKKLLVLLPLALFIAQPVKAQEAQQTNEAQTAQDNIQVAQSFSESSFDESVEKLPDNFVGNDPKRLYQTLAEKMKGKDEFETTAVYEERIKNSATEPLFGQLAPQSTFAVSVDLGGAAKYDADKEQFTVEVFVGDAPYDAAVSFNNKSASIYTNAVDEKILGTYMGENAYGAKREIVKKERWLYNLLIKDGKRFKETNAGSLNLLPWLTSLNFLVPMNAETAKAAKPNLKMLVVFNLAPPYTKEETNYYEPKVDSPNEVTVHKHYIYADVKSILLYNGITGEIYAVKKPK